MPVQCERDNHKDRVQVLPKPYHHRYSGAHSSCSRQEESNFTGILRQSLLFFFFFAHFGCELQLICSIVGLQLMVVDLFLICIMVT